jgi:cell division protein FtsB
VSAAGGGPGGRAAGSGSGGRATAGGDPGARGTAGSGSGGRATAGGGSPAATRAGGRGDPSPAGGRVGPPPRPKLTSRAAVLAVVICAIALSLAYPIRAYVAERRQIDQLEGLNTQLAGQLTRLRAERRAYGSPAYIEQQARDQLHMCFPSQKCYIVIYPSHPHGKSAQGKSGTPWYSALWKSVMEADRSGGR